MGICKVDMWREYVKGIGRWNLQREYEQRICEGIMWMEYCKGYM